jgi:putative OmpL-like beta-barrel porin-2
MTLPGTRHVPVEGGMKLSAMLVGLALFTTPVAAQAPSGPALPASAAAAAADARHDNYTRSFLFGYAIPFTHTGVRAAYQVNGVVSVLRMVANGWDNFKDKNDRKSVGAQLALTPVKPLTIYFNYLGSPERTDSRVAW